MGKIKLQDDFDRFLDGGFEFGIINNIYGPSGSGKTLLCMLACINMIKKGKRVVYIDSEGGFSIERFKQLTPDYEKILEKILFTRPNSFAEQKKAFEKIKETMNSEIDLIIVDSISMLYRLELGKNNQVYNINRELGLQVNFLNDIARKQNKGIIITSHVYSDFDNKDKVKMVGGDFLKYSSKCVIELENLNHSLRKAMIVRHRSLPENKEFYFNIKEKNIEKANSIINP